MKRARFLYAIATVAAVASLYLGLGLFLPGCLTTAGVGPGSHPAGFPPGTPTCVFPVSRSGVYTVNYTNGSGMAATTVLGDSGVGVIVVGDCTAVTSASLLKEGATADLILAKSASTTATVGQPLTYTLTVTNNGPDDALGVDLFDTLPPSVTFSSASDIRCAQTVPVGTVECVPPAGPLRQSAYDRFQIVVIPNATGTIVNKATVVSTVFDSNMTNNTDVATTTVGNAATGSADLFFGFNIFPSFANSGKTVTFMFFASNFGGPDTATNVVVNWELDGMATFTNLPSRCTAPTTTTTGGIITSCLLGDIPKSSGADLTISFTAVFDPTPGATNKITNNLSVVWDQTDPTPGDNNILFQTVVLP